MRIIVIEDNPADLRLFKESLAFGGISAIVSHFPDGASAVATLKSREVPWDPPPDVVFVDLNMPGVSGFEVLRILRSTPEFTNVRIVIFTSSQSPADIEEAARLKADRFVRKPTSLNDFFNAVSSTIRELTPD